MLPCCAAPRAPRAARRPPSTTPLPRAFSQIVIDTENAFRIERVAEIAEKRYGLDPAAVLDNIIVGRALTHEHQCELLAAAMAKIAEDEEPYRLLVLDSIMGLFRVEFSGRGELAERQQKLGAMLNLLK